MLKLMRRVPGGTLLIPMFLSALLNTAFPEGLYVGSISQAFFSAQGTNYIVGFLCFVSAMGLDVKSLAQIMKKQGMLLVIKFMIAYVLGFLMIKYLGGGTILGLSSLAIIVVLTSTNPALYMALVKDLSEKDDALAFGLAGVFCVPAVPLLVYSLSSGTDIVWTPIISVVIPLLAGMIIGNLDHEFRDFCLPAIGIIMPFFGWVLGDSINLFQAAKAGLAGIILSVLFYIILLPILYFTETKLLKANGLSAIALTSVAGVSLAAPSVIAQAYPELEPIVPLVVSQIAMAVVITSVLTPMIANKIAKKKNLVEH